MWQTFPPIAVIAFLLVVLVVVTNSSATRPTAANRRDGHNDVLSDLAREQRANDTDYHLTVRPPIGTAVVLITDSPYLRNYHGAAPGRLGAVVMHSGNHPHDSGVLVDWGVQPNDMVRMDLKELKLASPAHQQTPAHHVETGRSQRIGNT